MALIGTGDRAAARKSFQQALWINPLYNRAKQAFAAYCGDMKVDQNP